MKRIGVVSDTHGALGVFEACVRAAGDVDGWFHLGDYAWDAARLRVLSNLPVTAVYGNCDGYSNRDRAEVLFGEQPKIKAGELVVKVEDARILLCHGHFYDVDMGPWTLSYRAEELGCSAALYGHTHRGELSVARNVLMLNPGSPARPRGMSKPSIAVLTVDGRDVNASIITLK